MELTQKSYDLCMGYVALNMRAAALFGPTPYTGLVRWHERNHEVYDTFNRKITKYLGNQYGEVPEYKAPETYSYPMPKLMTDHVDKWMTYLQEMKVASCEMYSSAKKEAYDFILAEKFVKMNMVIGNELLYLSRFKKRIMGLPESELLYVNKKLHDYFEEHPDCMELDFSI